MLGVANGMDFVDGLHPVHWMQQPMVAAFVPVAWPGAADVPCPREPTPEEQLVQQRQHQPPQLQWHCGVDAGSSRTVARRLRRQRAARRSTAESPSRGLDDGGEPPALNADADLAAALEAGGAARAEALAALRGRVWRLSREARGCRAVQLAMEVADQREAAALVAELRGHVLELLRSPHGNYVLQKAVEALPVAHSGFVAEELAGHGSWVARHRFGCRVICRLVEHAAADFRTQALVDEALAEAEELCEHEFGHHTLAAILEHSVARHRHQVCLVLQRDLLRRATHRSASHLVQAVLVHGSLEDQRALVVGLQEEYALVTLADSQFGSFVLRDLLRHPEAHTERIHEHLQRHAGVLQRSATGQRFVQELGLRLSTSSEAEAISRGARKARCGDARARSRSTRSAKQRDSHLEINTLPVVA